VPKHFSLNIPFTVNIPIQMISIKPMINAGNLFYFKRLDSILIFPIKLGAF
jgi:hypothetical protein